MKISREEVEHVAHLARLTLGEEELEKMTDQLDTILQYVDKLDELDTADIEPTTHAFSIRNAFREDSIDASLSQKTSLRNCAESDGETFVVPRIIQYPPQ